jgi:hypothetical protein
LDIVLWRDIAPPGCCKLGSPRLWSAVKLHEGISLSDNFKIAGQIILSGKLRAYLVAALPDHALEFLPVSILNHKDRLASDDYFILHPLGPQDCIDLERSKVKWNPLKKQTIMNCKGLVLKPGAIPPGLKLFRPKYWGANVMATRAFADDLVSAGFTGLQFIDATGFDGIS